MSRTRDTSEEERWGRWLAAAQEGDRVAYEQLLRALLPVLRASVARRVRERDAVEDVVQNVLLAIHRARHTWRPERPFGPWWRAIARHAAIDHLRARQRRLGREEELAERHAEAAVAAPAAPDAELDPALRLALAELPPAQRQAVELVHLEELSIAEAAARVGVSPGALKLRAHRGVRALRRWLGTP
jgi:RNA polymerase sigma-70 factor (ECF subfamily)